MLTNGTTLAFKSGEAGEYAILPDLKEIPDIGGDPEMVENSRLNANYRQYEVGIGDAGDLVYKFVFDNTRNDSDYRKLKPLADGKTEVDFQQTYPDGTAIEFSATISIRIVSAGGLNTPVEFDMTCGLRSDINIKNPTTGV